MMNLSKRSLVFFTLLQCLLLPLGIKGVVLQAELANSSLPTPMGLFSTSYDGLDTLYIIGGVTLGGIERDILKYSLSQDTLQLVGSLPEDSGVYEAFAGNDRNGTHYIIGGSPGNVSSHIYKFQEEEESEVGLDLVGDLPEEFWSGFHPLPQPGNKGILYLVPSGETKTTTPKIYLFNTTTMGVSKEVPLPLLEGYDEFSFAGGAAYIEEGDYILIFGIFSAGGSVPNRPRYNVAVKYVIEEDRAELVDLPFGIESYFLGHVSTDGRRYVYILATFISQPFPALTFGFYRYDIVANEGQVFQVSGIVDPPQDFGWLYYATTLCVPSLNRVYIIGGNNHDPGAFLDGIWYVDLNLIPPQ